MIFTNWFKTSIILLFSASVWAQNEHVSVLGLFSERAYIQVNDQLYLLKQGDTTPEGVKLIKANSEQAELILDGKKVVYGLGNQITNVENTTVELAEIELWPNNGMYFTTGAVNGFSIDFLIDTGASAIAINADTALRLGLDYYGGEQTLVKTASGMTTAYAVTLNDVEVGGITLNNVEAVVLDGAEPTVSLLGMSFLGQLDIEHDGDKMRLKQKY